MGCLKIHSHPLILAPRMKDEVILVQCKDEWYEHNHQPAVDFLHKAEKIVAEYYPSRPIRKVIVTLLLSPNALIDDYIDKNDVHIVCNISHLRQRIKGMRKYNPSDMEKLLNQHLERRKIGDLRDEIVRPLLGEVIQYLKGKSQTSLTNFPSLALQCLRFFVNLTYFSEDEGKYCPFISDKL